MKFPTVETFLFCFKLESGSLFLGWYGVISSAISFLVALVALLVSLLYYDVLKEKIESENVYFDTNLDLWRIGVTLLLVVLMLYCVLYFYVSLLLIKGVHNRNANQVKPYLILIVLDTIISALSVLQFTSKALFSAIIGTIIEGYLVICIFSLWLKFHEEMIRGHNRHYQRAMTEKV